MINKLKREYLGKEDYYYQNQEIADIYPPIKRLLTELEEWLMKGKRDQYYDELLDVYFDLFRFINMAELYDSRYVTYIERTDEDIIVKLFCVDASYQLARVLEMSKAAIFFSATLTPLKYYRHILGGNEEDYIIRLPSPFPRDNLCLLIGDKVSTRYKDRDRTYMEVVDYIEEFILGKEGNYLVFFPSYKYMEQVYNIFAQRNPHIKTIIQDSLMDESEREDFLSQFDSYEESLVAFAVLGACFLKG